MSIKSESPSVDTFIESMNDRPPSLARIREMECIGCTKCIQACPVDAILGSAKVMHTVITDECTGCGLCLPPCPVDCIDMEIIASFPTDAAHYRQRFKARETRLQKEKASRTQQKNFLMDKKSYVAAALNRIQVKKAPHEEGNMQSRFFNNLLLEKEINHIYNFFLAAVKDRSKRSIFNKDDFLDKFISHLFTATNKTFENPKQARFFLVCVFIKKLSLPFTRSDEGVIVDLLNKLLTSFGVQSADVNYFKEFINDLQEKKHTINLIQAEVLLVLANKCNISFANFMTLLEKSISEEALLELIIKAAKNPTSKLKRLGEKLLDNKIADCKSSEAVMKIFKEYNDKPIVCLPRSAISRYFNRMSDSHKHFLFSCHEKIRLLGGEEGAVLETLQQKGMRLE